MRCGVCACRLLICMYSHFIPFLSLSSIGVPIVMVPVCGGVDGLSLCWACAELLRLSQSYSMGLGKLAEFEGYLVSLYTDDGVVYRSSYGM